MNDQGEARESFSLMLKPRAGKIAVANFLKKP